jgi:hypothetical protein
MSSPTRPALPPTDHVARALLQRGARDSARHLLRAAVRRDATELACAALLKALEARPDAAVSGPEITIDLTLVDAYLARGMLLEARAVLTGVGLDRSGPGAERARAIDELVAPIPTDAPPVFLEAARHLLTGGAAVALSLLDEQHQRGTPLPGWAEARRRTLRRLLLDYAAQRGDDAVPAPAGPASVTNVDALDVRGLVGRLLASRDVAGALRRLRAHCATHPQDGEAAIAAAALDELWSSLHARDAQPVEQGGLRTVPMSPSHTGDLNARMGNFEEAERIYRRVVMDDPGNAAARAMLAQVQAVRRYVAGVGEAPTPHAGSMRAQVEAAVAAAADEGTRPTEPLPIPNVDAIEASAMQTPTLAPPRPQRAAAPAAWAAAPELDDFAETTRYPEIEDEPTRRLPDAERTAAVAASRGPGHAGVRGAAEPASPGFVKKAASASGFAAGNYASARHAGPDVEAWQDDETTGVVEPALEAELLLKQGFAQRALEAFRFLAVKEPGDVHVARRIAEIESMIALERAPMPGEQTVRRDVDHLRAAARPTGRLSVPDDVRASVQELGRSASSRPHSVVPPAAVSTKDVRVTRIVILR